MLIGYARVSTEEQDLELQLAALKKAGCEKIYQDKMSGSKGSRPGLDQALEQCRAGDTLVVWKLDRAGRSIKNLIELAQGLDDREVGFRSLTDTIDTSTPSGRFFFHMMAALAQMERELTIERTNAGLAVARAAGRVGGRPKKMTNSKITSAQNLLASGMAPKDVATNLDISVPTLYRHLPSAVNN